MKKWETLPVKWWIHEEVLFLRSHRFCRLRLAWLTPKFVQYVSQEVEVSQVFHRQAYFSVKTRETDNKYDSSSKNKMAVKFTTVVKVIYSHHLFYRWPKRSRNVFERKKEPLFQSKQANIMSIPLNIHFYNYHFCIFSWSAMSLISSTDALFLFLRPFLRIREIFQNEETNK